MVTKQKTIIDMIAFTEEEIMLALCNNDRLKVAEIIGEIGVNYLLKEEDNDSLINYAISDPDSQIYKDILAYSPDLSLRNDLGENILHSAIYSGVKHRVEIALSSSDVNAASNDGTTPLLLAIGLLHEEIALFLIEKGADVSKSDKDGNRPIHLASFFGLSAVVGALLDKNAAVDVKTKNGNYPLSLAINNDFYDIAKAILQYHPGLSERAS